MNKKLSFKKCLNESLNKEDFKSDIYNALSDVIFKYRNNVTRSDIEGAIDWFIVHFFESGDIDIDESLETRDYNQFETSLFYAIKDTMNKFKSAGLTKEELNHALTSIRDYFVKMSSEYLNEKLSSYKKFGHKWYEDDSTYEITKVITKSGHTFNLGDKIKEYEITGFDPETNSIELEGADYEVEDIESMLNESCDSKVECIHSEYDDDFGKKENYYDVTTAHEFVDLDDTAPKARKYEESESEVIYDDDF